MNRALQGLLLGATVWTGVRLLRAAPMEFRGKVVLIIGGSRGLGLVLARTFGAAGAQVVISARSAPELERAEFDLRARGVDVRAVPCDLTDPEQAQALLHLVQHERGGLDVLVNCAGVIQVGPQEVMTLGDYREAMDVNFFAALHATLAALPYLRRPGRIVNIASIGGKISVPHLLPYSASKFALVGFSQGLRAELAQYGILVTTVCPGLLRTGSPRNAIFKGRHREEYAWFRVADSLPIISLSAERAARQIVAACGRGTAEVWLGAPTWLAVPMQGLFPGLISSVMAQVSRLLPRPGGIGTGRATGAQSEGVPVPAAATVLGDRAAMRNNEVG